MHLKWKATKLPLPTGGVPLDMWSARVTDHGFLISRDPSHPGLGYNASYKPVAHQLVPTTMLGQATTLEAAQALCAQHLINLNETFLQFLERHTGAKL